MPNMVLSLDPNFMWTGLVCGFVLGVIAGGIGFVWHLYWDTFASVSQ